MKNKKEDRYPVLGIMHWVKVARMDTEEAANVKDYLLRRKIDRRFKEIAKELMAGKGYIIATDFELELMYPGMLKTGREESKKMIWSVNFSNRKWPRCGGGQKMGFCPIR